MAAKRSATPRSHRSRTDWRAARAAWSTSRTVAAHSRRSTARRRAAARVRRDRHRRVALRGREAARLGGWSWSTRARGSRPRTRVSSSADEIVIGWPDENALPQLEPRSRRRHCRAHPRRAILPSLPSPGALASEAFDQIGALGLAHRAGLEARAPARGRRARRSARPAPRPLGARPRRGVARRDRGLDPDRDHGRARRAAGRASARAGRHVRSQPTTAA